MLSAQISVSKKGFNFGTIGKNENETTALLSVSKKAIFKLISSPSIFSNPKAHQHFISTLLTTYIYWTTTAELLKEIKTKIIQAVLFLEEQIEIESKEPLNQNSQDEKIRKKKQKSEQSLEHLINLLEKWLHEYPNTFDTSSRDIINQLFDFLSNHSQSSLQTLKSAFSKNVYQERKNRATLRAPPISKLTLSRDAEILQIKPLELARQLTIYDHKLLNNIPITEYKNPQGNPNEHKRLNAFLQRSESVSGLLFFLVFRLFSHFILVDVLGRLRDYFNGTA